MVSFKELPYVAQIGIVALLVILLAGGAYYVQSGAAAEGQRG